MINPFKTAAVSIVVGFVVLLNHAFAQMPLVPAGVEGYTVKVRDSWLSVAGSSGAGFRPVRVTIETNPARVVAVDEVFTVTVRTQQYSHAARETSGKLVIPAGQKSAVVELYINDHFARFGNNNQLRIVNDRGQQILSELGWSPDQVPVQPSMLVVSSLFPVIEARQHVCYKRIAKPGPLNLPNYNPPAQLPSFGELNLVYDSSSLLSGMSIKGLPNGPMSVISPWSAISANRRLKAVRPSDLPFSWIGLQSVERILISLEELKSLSRSSHPQRANFEKWVMAGGVLIVYETGPQFAGANDIWKCLLGSERAHLADRNLAKWVDPADSFLKENKLLLPQDFNFDLLYEYDQGVWASESQNAEMTKKAGGWQTFDDPTKIPASTKFTVAPYLEGRIVAVADDMTKWTWVDWRQLQNVIAVGGGSVSRRFTSSLRSDSTDVTFGIPGVGQPPIQSFQVLIGIFLLTAGPVMMLVLRRTGQLQYLFVFVPLLSLVVCFSLFSYAVIFDGSNQWGRVNSVTYLDHRTNQAITHTHTSYYSGVNPQKYKLQPDALGVAFQRENSAKAVSAFEQNTMVLSGGDIMARMPHEVITVCPQSATERLLILESEDIDSPQVKNLLGDKVKFAVIRTETGLFKISGLNAGAEIQATKVDEKNQTNLGVVSDKLTQMVEQMSPELVGGRSRNYHPYYGYNNDSGGFGEEDRIVVLLREGKALEEIVSEPGTYLAILEEFPLAAEQIEPVEYKLQLHIVCGKWK